MLQLGLVFHCWPLPVLPGDLPPRAVAFLLRRAGALIGASDLPTIPES